MRAHVRVPRAPPRHGHAPGKGIAEARLIGEKLAQPRVPRERVGERVRCAAAGAVELIPREVELLEHLPHTQRRAVDANTQRAVGTLL